MSLALTYFCLYSKTFRHEKAPDISYKFRHRGENKIYALPHVSLRISPANTLSYFTMPEGRSWLFLRISVSISCLIFVVSSSLLQRIKSVC